VTVVPGGAIQGDGDSLEKVTSSRTTEKWLKQFEECEIAAGPINTVEEFFQHPLADELGLS
jgi:crotonobetainyl-CoA:carnitine CoA-transferase CaiB-like acyl-CoA transferase